MQRNLEPPYARSYQDLSDREQILSGIRPESAAVSEHPGMWSVHSMALQNISARVNASLSRSVKAKRKDGKTVLPKMRVPNMYRSFEFPSARFFSMEGGKQFLRKMKKVIGRIRYRCDQNIQVNIKTCSV